MEFCDRSFLHPRTGFATGRTRGVGLPPHLSFLVFGAGNLTSGRRRHLATFALVGQIVGIGGRIRVGWRTIAERIKVDRPGKVGVVRQCLAPVCPQSLALVANLFSSVEK